MGILKKKKMSSQAKVKVKEMVYQGETGKISNKLLVILKMSCCILSIILS